MNLQLYIWKTTNSRTNVFIVTPVNQQETILI